LRIGSDNGVLTSAVCVGWLVSSDDIMYVTELANTTARDDLMAKGDGLYMTVIGKETSVYVMMC